MSTEQQMTLKAFADTLIKLAIALIMFFSAQTFYDIKSSINKQDQHWEQVSNDMHTIKERLIKVETKMEVQK